MIKEVIDYLPEVLKKHTCTLKKASTDTTNQTCMCESQMKVIDFDKIPNEYARGKGWNGVPKSNDALYVDALGKWYFIEFKNGSVHKDEIYRKIYDSFIMLMEWKIIPNFDFCRNNVEYILVYNEGKYGTVQESSARAQNYNYFLDLAEQEERLFDVDKFEKYLFHETHTYTPNNFAKKFVYLKEQEEEERK